MSKCVPILDNCIFSAYFSAYLAHIPAYFCAYLEGLFSHPPGSRLEYCCTSCLKGCQKMQTWVDNGQPCSKFGPQILACSFFFWVRYDPWYGAIPGDGGDWPAVFFTQQHSPASELGACVCMSGFFSGRRVKLHNILLLK